MKFKLIIIIIVSSSIIIIIYLGLEHGCRPTSWIWSNVNLCVGMYPAIERYQILVGLE